MTVPTKNSSFDIQYAFMEDLIDNSTIDKANGEYSKCKGLLTKPVHQVSICMFTSAVYLTDFRPFGQEDVSRGI